MLSTTNLLLAHPFWQDILAINPQSKNSVISTIAASNTEFKTKFLTTVVKGFYPLTSVSPLVFKRLEEVTADEAKHIAKAIYNTELGLKPLIKGTSYDGITHPEQFRLLIESLLDDCVIEAPLALTQRFIDMLAINDLPLSKILGYASVIEHNGPYIINALQDFVSQWQTFTKRRSSFIKFQFIYEHGLIEGNEGEAQHIVMVNKMAGQYANTINESEFEQAIHHFITSYHILLDSVYEEIMLLVPVLNQRNSTYDFAKSI